MHFYLHSKLFESGKQNFLKGYLFGIISFSSIIFIEGIDPDIRSVYHLCLYFVDSMELIAEIDFFFQGETCFSSSMNFANHFSTIPSNRLHTELLASHLSNSYVQLRTLQNDLSFVRGRLITGH